MEKTSVTDEWLYQYMPIIDEAMIRELEKHTDYEYQFTNKFEHQMKKLIWQETHPWIGILCRLSKKAVILFVCILSSLFVLTMSVQAYRIKFFETVKSITEDSIVYSYFVGKNLGTIQYSEPSYIPEGYQEVDRVTSVQLFSVTYTRESGEMITWDQMLIQDGGVFVADSEYDEEIVKNINGKAVMIFLYDNGFIRAQCEYGKYVYVLTADNLSIDEVCAMFDNIAFN